MTPSDSSATPVAAQPLPPKPLPIPSDLARPFWDALRRKELQLQRCDNCGHYNHPPRISCPRCHGHALTWTPVKPEGTVYSYTIVFRPPVPAFKADVPYAVALVDITGTGVKLLSNLDAVPDSLRVDMPVDVVFDAVTPEMSLFRFKPKTTGSR
jgi:uncharacterized OB-fold protein